MDPYAPCPCGSGKKVKFCCQAILPEMEKIRRLQENHQPRMALQLIDKLLKSHPDNAWLSTQRALALFNEQKMEEARDTLVSLLRKHPDLPLANGLLALAMTELEPIPKCMKVIHRAFLKSMAAEPQLCAVLADILADHFSGTGQDMAARQHLALILRLGSDEQRREAIDRMLELDADQDVPYPFRGGCVLPKFPISEEGTEAKKALRLFQHGCFSEAADQLDQVVQRSPDCAELRHAVGLLRAWAGEDGPAAEALHAAAKLYSTESTAVDVESLAQLFDRREKGNLVAARMRTYKVDSLSRLLTRLDNEDRLCRVPNTRVEPSVVLAASYEILDRPCPRKEELDRLTLDSAPRTLGQLALFDAAEEGQEPVAMITALEGRNFDEVVRVFEAAAGELAKRHAREAADGADTPPDEDPVVSWYSKDELTLSEPLFVPPGTPGNVARDLRRQSVARCLEQTWLNAPQPGLQGKSPLEAAGDDGLRVPLRAAIRVFDAFLDRRGVILDTRELESRLKLEPLPPVAVASEQDVNLMSVSDMERVPLETLSDDTFFRLLQRALAVKHGGLDRRVLIEFLTNRRNLVAQHESEAEQAYGNLSDLCFRSLNDEEALKWLNCGFEFSKAHGHRFDHLVLWKMRELLLRIQDPESPGTKELLLELWNYYGAKLPTIRARLSAFVEQMGIAPPWESAIITPQSAGEGQLVWAAETAETASTVNKLWLPD